MNAMMQGHKVVFAASGDKYYPVSLIIDGLFIGKYDSYDMARGKAREVVTDIGPAEASQ
jgi:hypothetical protein